MINRPAFVDLLSRYEVDRCTPEERELVEQWYELLGEPITLPLTEEEWHIMEQKLWRRVRPVAKNEGRNPVRRVARSLYVVVSGLAALIAVVIGLNWNTGPMSDRLAPGTFVAHGEKADWILYENETARVKEIQLPDGSQVILAAEARLAVHKDFHRKNREVRLLGEAGFDVQRDSLHPFLVYSGEIITKVLGTTFHIQASNPEKPILVTVSSGRVTVYRQAGETGKVVQNSGVILTPNQKATYFPDNQQFVTGIVEGPLPIEPNIPIPSSTSLVFSETPIREVIRELEVRYGTEIELDQESLGDCPFTGNLQNKEMYTQLELLCGTVNGSYEVRGTKILLTGKGCQ